MEGLCPIATLRFLGEGLTCEPQSQLIPDLPVSVFRIATPCSVWSTRVRWQSVRPIRESNACRIIAADALLTSS